jgi:hypothetical protein
VIPGFAPTIARVARGVRGHERLPVVVIGA